MRLNNLDRMSVLSNKKEKFMIEVEKSLKLLDELHRNQIDFDDYTMLSDTIIGLRDKVVKLKRDIETIVRIVEVFQDAKESGEL